MGRIRGLAVLFVLSSPVVTAATAQASQLGPQDFIVTAESTGFTFTGQFTFDNDFALVPLTIDARSVLDITISTYNLTDRGFDPMLFLLDASGGQAFGVDSDGITPIDVNAQDAGTLPLHAIVDAGTYTLAVSQLFNYPNITTPGFSFDDDPFYTCQYLASPEGDCRGFIDPFIDPEGIPTTLSGTIRGSITVTPLEQPAPVPEPGTLALMATGVGWLAARRRRTRAPSSRH